MSLLNLVLRGKLPTVFFYKVTKIITEEKLKIDFASNFITDSESPKYSLKSDLFIVVFSHSPETFNTYRLL